MAGSNVAFVDVGSTTICTIMAEVTARATRVLGVGCAASRGIQKGAVVHVDDATGAIRESVERAQGSSTLQVTRGLVGFSGKHIASTNPMVSVETARQNRVVTDLVMAQVEKEIQAVAFAEDRAKVNIVNRQFAIDRVGGIRNPLGMHGHRLDLEAHIVTADLACLENLALCLGRAGVPVLPGSFVANPLACGRAVLEPEDMESGVMLVDIGGGVTGIAVFKEGSIWYTSALPVGGRQVTNDLAVGLNIPFSAAEELKTSCGSLYAGVQAEGAAGEMYEKLNTSAEQVNYIIRSRMEEILRMVRSRSPYVPGTMVLTGGGANLPGIEQFVREVLGIEARVGRPQALTGALEGLQDPAYAACVGLVLWGAGDTEIECNGNGSHGNGSNGEPVLKPIISGLLSGWLTLWSRRPRVTFGQSSQPEA